MDKKLDSLHRVLLMLFARDAADGICDIYPKI